MLCCKGIQWINDIRKFLEYRDVVCDKIRNKYLWYKDTVLFILEAIFSSLSDLENVC